MSTADAARHALYTRLEGVLGHEHADTLMSYLPSDRSGDVATKGDIARFEARLDNRMDGFEQRMDRLEQRMDRPQQRRERLEQRMGRFGETRVSQQQF
jgi:hypothetical protein